MKLNEIDSSFLNEREIPMDIMDELVSQFKNTTGEFTNASHKFFSARKTLVSKNPERSEDYRRVSPSDFFAHFKASKVKHNAPKESTNNTKTLNDELTPPTMEDLKASGSGQLASTWAKHYSPTYTEDEIVKTLMQSPLGDYEDYVFIRDAVRDGILEKKRESDNVSMETMRPEMESQFKSSAEELQSMRNTEEFEDAIRKIAKDFLHVATAKDNNKSASDNFKKVRDELASRHDSFAMNRFFRNDKRDVIKNAIKQRDLYQSISPTEFFNWYKANKTTLKR